MNPRFRLLALAAAVLAVAWALALAGFSWARAAKPTAAKVAAYLGATDLAGLSGEDRARALRRLADLLNALPPDERRKARMTRLWQGWFAEMTDDERGNFLEATVPSGFQQMLTSFEQMPPERRQRAIDEAVKRLREAREAMDDGELAEAGDGVEADGGPPVVLTEEWRERIATIGLKTYYSESSAKTKAELAPLLEELQRMLEGGVARRLPFRRLRE